MKRYLPESYASATLELIRQGYDPEDVHALLLRKLEQSGARSQLKQILASMEEYLSFGEGEHVTVTSARELSQEQRTNITTQLERSFKPVSIAWKENPGLIGGIVIKHGDDVMTYSIISIVDQLRTHLEK